MSDRMDVDQPGERWEDVFTEITRQIPNERWAEFARQRDGLGLDDDAINRIAPHLGNITQEQKYQMLREWQKKNAGATMQTIKDIARAYMAKLPQPAAYSKGGTTVQQTNYGTIHAKAYNNHVETLNVS